MNKIDAIRKLREQVEAGTVGDWGFSGGIPRRALGCHWEEGLAAYSGSLDAAKALHDALLPAWDVDLEIRLILSDATLYHPSGDYDRITSGTHENPARAWLIAILRALEAQEGGE